MSKRGIISVVASTGTPGETLGDNVLQIEAPSYTLGGLVSAILAASLDPVGVVVDLLARKALAIDPTDMAAVNTALGAAAGSGTANVFEGDDSATTKAMQFSHADVTPTGSIAGSSGLVGVDANALTPVQPRLTLSAFLNIVEDALFELLEAEEGHIVVVDQSALTVSVRPSGSAAQTAAAYAAAKAVGFVTEFQSTLPEETAAEAANFE